MTKLRSVCTAAILTALASGTAYADATANIGFMSDYIFRGAYQSESTAFGGIDISGEDGGVYAGMWGANLKDGLEYDIYIGYAGGGENFQWYVGGTGYYYTDEFDDTYKELNLGFTYGFLTVDYAIGDYDNPSALPAGEDTQTYQYVGFTVAPEMGPYYFVGRTDYKNIDRADDTMGVGRIPGTGANGYWFEIGKSFELMDDLELNIAALFSGDVPQPPSTTPSSVQLGPSACLDFGDNCTAHDAEYALTFTLTKYISIEQ